MLMDDGAQLLEGLTKRITALEAELKALRQENATLRERGALYGQLTEIAGQGIWALDAEDRTVFVNSRIAEMLGYSVDEMLGKSVLAFIDEGTWPVAKDRLDRYRRGEKGQFDAEYLRKDGSVLLAIVSSNPLFDGDGRYLGVAGMITDVTRRKRTEGALAESEERFRRAILHSPLPVMIHAEDGEILLVSDVFTQLTGYTLDDIPTLAVWIAMGYRARPEAVKIDTEGCYPFETGVREQEIRTASGETRLWDVTSAPLGRLPDGREAVISMAVDVTERQRAEEDLRQSEEKYRQLFEMESDALFLIDNLSGEILEVNAAAAHMYGYTREELLALKNTDLSAESEKTRQAMRDHARTILVRWHRRKDGSIFPVEIMASHLIWRGRELHIAAIREITERIRSEEALRESEARFQRLADNTKNFVFRYQVKPTLGYTYVKSSPDVLGGYTPDEFYADPHIAYKIIHPDDRHLFDTIMRGESFGQRLTLRWINKKGQTVWTEAVYLPVLDSQGDLVAVEGIIRDITEQKLLEDQLLRAQRLESAGRVAGQVAHDFNNLLGPMVVYPDLIKSELPEDHLAAAYCDDMLKAAQLMAKLNEDMLTLSRRGLIMVEPVDLNYLVRQSLKQGAPMPSGLAVEIELDPEVPAVAGSPAQILRVLSNLIGNARDAMDDLGRLWIRTEVSHLDKPIGQYSQVRQGKYVKLSIGDTGCGIPPAIQDRIFDAFFTTKRLDRRRGSGLGLSIVQNVVEDHGGYIDLESREGEGTTFHVYLPIHEQDLKSNSTAEAKAGNERVLVVDDDDLQRRLVSRTLESLGYRVATVASGEEAVVYVQDHEADLLILDMQMPGIDGAETYRQVIQRRAGQRAVILSGYAQTERVAEALNLGAGRFVGKPVSLKDLARAVREELDREPAGRSQKV